LNIPTSCSLSVAYSEADESPYAYRAELLGRQQSMSHSWPTAWRPTTSCASQSPRTLTCR
jgi:hypothetical protein